MNITDAAHMARRLMNDHGLGHVPFEFDGGKRRLGCTHWRRVIGGYSIEKITLSRHFTNILPEDEIRDVILHEIAHALAGHENNHNYTWKQIARSIGAKPERCATPSASVGGHAWTGQCPAGHDAGKMHRAPRRIRSCALCSPKFNVDHLIKWNFNGKPATLDQMPVSYQDEYRKKFEAKTILV